MSWVLVACLGLLSGGVGVEWIQLGPGVEYGRVQLVQGARVGDGRLHVVRVDPERAELRVGLASQQGGGKRTAAKWASELGLVAVINAGMFATDHSTNVGYLRDGKHLNNGRWNDYRSALAFGGAKPGQPKLSMVDLDVPGAKESLSAYRTVIQNLRMVKGEGVNVWQPNSKEWSEAAVGIDRKGRLLLLFIRTPLSVHALNEKLVGLPLELVKLMHVEGGPEASLSIRSKVLTLDLSGSFETGFNENDQNSFQWPIPNVIGVVARAPQP